MNERNHWSVPGIAVDISMCGDSAVIVHAFDPDLEARWQVVHTFARYLRSHNRAHVTEVVASYDRLLVEFDCGRYDHAEIVEVIRAAAPQLEPLTLAKRRLFRVPAVYGGEFGPDLPEVSRQLDLPANEVIRLHCSVEWTVRITGAPVGAPLLDGTPYQTSISRNPRPRISVPAGSVALAGLQSHVYPVDSPGGWRLIGKTPLRLVDPARDPIISYTPGDRFRFFPIAFHQWSDHNGELEPCDE